MPQLDSLTYFSQFFWFITIFLSFYIILSNVVIPNIATILKIRNKMIKSGLSTINKEKNIVDIDSIILNALKK